MPLLLTIIAGVLWFVFFGCRMVGNILDRRRRFWISIPRDRDRDKEKERERWRGKGEIHLFEFLLIWSKREIGMAAWVLLGREEEGLPMTRGVIFLRRYGWTWDAVLKVGSTSKLPYVWFAPPYMGVWWFALGCLNDGWTRAPVILRAVGSN